MEKSEINRRMDQALLDSGIARENQESSPNISQNSQTVLERRYLRRDKEGAVAEEPREMFQRVAQNLSQADLNYGASEQDRQATQDEFYDVMRRLEFLPNSPTLMNAGRELQQLSACFVLPIDDSLDDIFSKVKETALIHKSGGGTGFSFNRLRPSGDFVKSTGGVASGPASFIRAFDSATDVVKQGGTRRGANMGILNVDHPDVMKFIRMKAQEGALENFNISIAVTREFMEKVKQGEDYALVNPRTGEEAGILNAREVFTEIVEQAWKTGDPGLIFLDRINDQNPNPHLGRIESTNPCFAGSIRMATDQGLLTFRELYDRQTPISVLTDNRVPGIRQAEMEARGGTATAIRMNTGTTLREAVPVFLTRRNWPVFRLETKHGYEITATEDHKIFTPDGVKSLGELQPGDEILIQSAPGTWSENRSLPAFTPGKKLRGRIERGEANLPKEWTRDLGELLGWITGDGWVSHELPQGRNIPTTTVGIMFGNPQKIALAPKFQDLIQEWLGMTGNETVRNGTKTLYYKTALWNFLESLGMNDSDSPEKTVPEAIWSAPRDAVLGYLSGLFSADGTVNVSSHKGSCSVRLASSSEELLKGVQLLLINEGIVTKLYLRREAGMKEMPGSDRQPKLYQHRAQYELVMDGASRDTFIRNIGFLIPEKQEKAREWMNSRTRQAKLESFTDQVKSISPHGEEEVYCTTESVTHSIIANGIVAAQCGEQPLSPYESCNLGSVNLARMVRHTGRTEIDWEKLERVIRTGVHLLDNVIDMNDYPLPQIEEASERSRRIGLGVMGTADLLIQMGIRYDSEEALELVKEVMSFIRDRTHQASHELAILRGSYPGWDGSTYSRPMRNTAPVTIAPTGTISIIAGASSGIEPLFALAYTRNIMDRTRLRELNPYFDAVTRTMDDADDDLMESLMEQVVQTGSLEGTRAPAWMKDIFRVSQDISPEWHVRMQAAFQEHTDNSVSKTINFPGSATQEDIREAYMLAYETGCNGITVYRDGSKTEQVLSTGGDQQRTLERTLETGGNGFHPAPRPRPRTMSGSTVLVRTGHGNMYTTINVDDQGKPFELFTTVGKAGGCDSAQIEAISRLVSMALRSGQDPNEIYRQLRGITCCPNWDEGTLVRSIPDGVAIALGQYTTIQDQPDEGAQLMNGRHRCPDCNAPTSFREGCQACSAPDCGWNKCD